jgi:carbonic anhydrase
MERLHKGVKSFKTVYFPEEEALFKELAKGQSPDTLFFSCSDSRIDPNIITQSKPGELFIVKNIGNIVPPCTQQWKKSGSAAAIEYALVFLNIANIVVCAHSDCGAMKALYMKAEDFKELPHLKEWIDTAKPARDRVERLNNELSQTALNELTAKEHVIVQLENLKTFPLVTKALDAGRLKLHGWYYDIGAGTVHAYNESKNTFEEIS